MLCLRVVQSMTQLRRLPSARASAVQVMATTLSVSQIHPMGVAFRVLLKFADSVDEHMTSQVGWVGGGRRHCPAAQCLWETP